MQSGVGTWTRYFAVASAVSMVLLQVSQLVDAPLRARTIIGLFGAVLPMIFGMGYLLIPSYVGRTLANPSVAPMHFLLAYLGTGLLLADTVFHPDASLLVPGIVLWTGGVALFVVAVGYTVIPALVRDPAVVTRRGNRPQRTTRLATALVPVALAYLVAGTVAGLATIDRAAVPIAVGFPTTVHFYATGVGALLVFTLGIRLLTGFFHVVPPRSLSWVVLGAGGTAPLLLAPNLWTSPWFEAGALLFLTAMAGYACLVAIVGYRTEYRRVGMDGIALGAVAGVVGTALAALFALDIVGSDLLYVHVTLLLDGFFLLTIIGYAYQFFPVTAGTYVGASERAATGSIVALAVGVGLRSVGTAVSLPLLDTVGIGLALAGTAGYAYLLGRRLLTVG